jgi:hypothetical protein
MTKAAISMTEHCSTPNWLSHLAAPMRGRRDQIAWSRGQADRPAGWGSLAGLTGFLMGTKRVSLVRTAGAVDARKMASKRKMKISDNIGPTPWFGDVGTCCRRQRLG